MNRKKIRTHYDNLKVARDAPSEVIRAAYKALSQRFHPDKNPGDERATRIMTIVNASYAILSDPRARAEHDAWISTQEGQPATPNPKSSSQRGTIEPSTSQQTAAPKRTKSQWAWAIFSGTIIYGFYGSVLLGFGYLLLSSESETKPSNLPAYDANPSPPLMQEAPSRQLYLRPPFAPNGEPWPTRAGYLAGYPRLHSDGLSTITIDNGSNDSDVFVKLVAIQANSTFPVRHLFIPARSKMRLNSVRVGLYDIRYQELSSGHLLRSESFDLDEIQEPDGVRFSNVTMTLYKVANGNFQTYPLSANEF